MERKCRSLLRLRRCIRSYDYYCFNPGSIVVFVVVVTVGLHRAHTQTQTIVFALYFPLRWRNNVSWRCKRVADRNSNTNKKWAENVNLKNKNSATRPTVLRGAEQLTGLGACAHLCIHGSRWEPAAGKKRKGGGAQEKGVFCCCCCRTGAALRSSPRFLFVSIALVANLPLFFNIGNVYLPFSLSWRRRRRD